MQTDRLTALVWLLAPFSLLSFGGGPALYAPLQHEVVDTLHWLTPGQFVDLFAIARAAPGPGIMLSTLIGWKVAGWAGALVATAAIFVPASLLCLAFTKFYERHRGKGWSVALEAGLAPIAVGLIISGSIGLLTLDGNGPLTWIVAAGSAALCLLRPKVHPFVLLGGGAAIFAASLLTGH